MAWRGCGVAWCGDFEKKGAFEEGDLETGTHWRSSLSEGLCYRLVLFLTSSEFNATTSFSPRQGCGGSPSFSQERCGFLFWFPYPWSVN